MTRADVEKESDDEFHNFCDLCDLYARNDLSMCPICGNQLEIHSKIKHGIHKLVQDIKRLYHYGCW